LTDCICCTYCKRWGDCPIYWNGKRGHERFGWGFSAKGGFECGGFSIGLITPEQYKKRTGKDYMDKAPVWRWGSKERGWVLCEFGEAKRDEALWAVDGKKFFIYCAYGPPPADWRPGE